MSKKENVSDQKNNIKIGNVSNVSGNINIAGGDINFQQTTTGLSATEIKQLFDQLYSAIETRPGIPGADKEDLRAEVKEVQVSVTEAVQKNEKLDEGSLSRHFRNIARMAPDILDVIVATLANPLAGLGIAVKKIAEKAKEETQKS